MKIAKLPISYSHYLFFTFNLVQKQPKFWINLIFYTPKYIIDLKLSKTNNLTNPFYEESQLKLRIKTSVPMSLYSDKDHSHNISLPRWHRENPSHKSQPSRERNDMATHDLYQSINTQKRRFYSPYEIATGFFQRQWRSTSCPRL